MKKPKEAHQLIYEVWGAAVRGRRKAAGLSQVALAEEMDVAQSTISEVETGTYRALTPPLILKFCVALDCEPGELFAWPVGVGAIAQFNAATKAAA